MFCFLNYKKFGCSKHLKLNKILKQPIAVTTEVSIAEALLDSCINTQTR